jgi:hypothetical protein
LFRDKLILLSIITGIIWFSSCKKEPEPLFSNSVIKGSALAYNSNEIITVVANGPYGKTTINTENSGGYMFTGLGNGTYRLDFTNEGYGTIRIYGIQLYGNDTVTIGQVRLFKKYDNYLLPVFRKVSINTDILGLGAPVIVVETNLTDFTPNMPIVFFMDVNKNVDYKNYSYCPPYYEAGKFSLNRDNIDLLFRPDNLPYRSGTEVYIIAYVANPDEVNFGYFNTYLGISQFSTLVPEKHSQVMSFIMP